MDDKQRVGSVLKFDFTSTNGMERDVPLQASLLIQCKMLTCLRNINFSWAVFTGMLCSLLGCVKLAVVVLVQSEAS